MPLKHRLVTFSTHKFQDCLLYYIYSLVAKFVTLSTREYLVIVYFQVIHLQADFFILRTPICSVYIPSPKILQRILFPYKEIKATSCMQYLHLPNAMFMRNVIHSWSLQQGRVLGRGIHELWLSLIPARSRNHQLSLTTTSTPDMPAHRGMNLISPPMAARPRTVQKH
jgi:hypothetical protein